MQQAQVPYPEENQHRGNRIAKNTLYLYGQMMVQLFVSLFTARVVINTLGEVEYGIFSVVGGVTSTLIVLNSIEAATMRFITYAQGEGKNINELHKVFSTAWSVHLTIAIIAFLLAETVGLYYVCHYLVIPPERLTATIIIYQFSVFTTLISIMCAPYDALIVAHERIGVFASIGIYNVLINLLIVFLVKYYNTDKLILYSALIMLVQVSMRLIYGWYCNRSFPEIRGPRVFDKKLFVEMMKFGGWSFNGALASMGYTQGINLMLNYFFNTVMNTAYGVASIVQSKIYTFAENFLTAVKPQMVKSYASGDLTYMHKLVITSSRFSLLLLFMLSLPVLLEPYYILIIWLGNVPSYTVWFVRLTLLCMMVDSLGRVMCMAIHATGRIAKFQMIEANLLLLIIPLGWICLKLGYPPTSVFIVQLCIFVITQITRMFIVCPAIKMSIWLYFKEVILRCMLAIISGSILPLIVHENAITSPHPLSQVIIVTAVSIFSSSIAIYFIGCDRQQRQLIISKIKAVINTISDPR